MQLTNDSSIEDFKSLSQTTTSKCGLSGSSTIVPLASNQEIFWMQSQRSFLEVFYNSLWLCRRVVEIRPYQMGSAWGNFINKDGDRNHVDHVNKWMRGLRNRYVRCQISANLYGGSTMIRFVDDGGKPNEPVDRENIKKVRYSRVLDRWELYPDPMSYYKNPDNPEFYLLAIDPVELSNMFADEEQMSAAGEFVDHSLLDRHIYSHDYSYLKIHRDRVTRFNGDYLTIDSLKHNQGWYGSRLVPFLSPCLRYLETIGYVGAATKTFEFTLFLVENLYSMMSSSKGREVIEDKTRINQEMLTAINAMLADKKTEDVKIVSRQFSGVSDIIKDLKDEMHGASGLDDIELWGKHPKGLQATGQSERLEKARKIKEMCSYQWGTNVEGDPSDDILGDLQLYLLSDESPYGGEPNDYSWIWSSEVSVTPSEEAEIYDIYSRADNHYVNTGVLSPDEVRSRFEGDVFSNNIIADDELFNKMVEEKKEKEERVFEQNNQKFEAANEAKKEKTKSKDSSEKLILEPGDDEVLSSDDFARLVEEIELEYKP